MDDVFEDVVSAEEFSDVDDDEDHNVQTALSDDEIARMLGLLGDGDDNRPRGGRPTPPAAVEAAEEATATTTQAHETEGVEPTRVARGMASPVTAATSKPPADVSDFDRFLADFTRQEALQRATAPHKQSLTATGSGEVVEVEVPSMAPPYASVAEKSRAQNGITAFEALFAKDSVTYEATAKSGSVALAPPKWGVFTPDKMPPRREFESLRVTRAPLSSSPKSKITSPKKLKVVVPSVAYLRTKNVRVQRSSEPADKELTFRPTINKAYYRRRGMARLRSKTTTRFSTRMQQDIREREERHKRREAEKRKREECDARLPHQRRRSLVTKGSQAILERNGLWEEPLEDRLQRLFQQRSTRQFKSIKASSSATSTSRKRDTLREKEAAKARACESLYRRGLDKLQRARDGTVPRTFQSPSDRRSRHRSDSIVRERLERDVQMICGHDVGPEQSHGEGPASPQSELPSSVSFVEFSCVLLYFGFVPAPSTPWEGDAQVSLLWHAWVTHAEGDREARRVKMTVLKRLLELVIVKHPHSAGSVRRESSHHDPKARLLEIFRLHYVARKRPRGVSSAEPKHGAKHNDSTGRPRQPTAVTYTIHGKAIAPTAHPCDLLAVRHSLAQQRVKAMRREKEQEELAECTFKPRISSVSAKESLGGNRFKEADDASVSTEPEAFDRLYSDAFVRQNNSVAQYFRARQEEEEKCKKEMCVLPTYVNGLTVEERLDRLHESLSNNALPVHFHEKIARMRHAYAAKVEDAREKASRLEPAHAFPRSKDGHTIVVPFKFATQQRTKENRRKGVAMGNHLRLDARARSRSTSAILRDMRLHYAPPAPIETGCVEADECGRGGGEDDHNDAADLCIDVHVSPFETYQLCLNQGDDAYDATKVFADTYNLDAHQHKQLLRHAQAKLEELFDL